ncbi:MAG: hypothetical protein IJV16_06985 [Lachnospiraceae bacterium]|nr:hypothetical protein [Lachnospiraceae bacterium]
MVEIVRLIDALGSAGWTEKQINDLFMYVGSGKEEYKPIKNSHVIGTD